MTWWAPLAFGSSLQPTILPDAQACSDPNVPEAAIRHAAAHLAAIGVPEGATSVGFGHRLPNCCPPLTVTVLDAADQRLGVLELSDDCSLLRVDIAGEAHDIPSFPLPVGPTPATAIVAAWPSLSERATAADWVVGWADRRGFRVALVRVWPAVTVSVGDVWLAPDGEIRRIRREIRAFTVPDDAMARTGASFGLVEDEWITGGRAAPPRRSERR